MCGRYANHIQDMHDWSDILIDWPLSAGTGFNVAPAQVIPVYTAQGTQAFRWGLVPPWHKGGPIKFSTFNARIEGVEAKPSYRHAWSTSQRCLIPALGYYEWRKEGSRKQPYFISALDANPIVFAGLWEPGVAGYLEGSCTILTRPASNELASLHPRMPCMLSPAQSAAWLRGNTKDASEILHSSSSLEFQYYPVSTQVNNAKNQDVSLLEPIASGDLFSEVD